MAYLPSIAMMFCFHATKAGGEEGGAAHCRVREGGRFMGWYGPEDTGEGADCGKQVLIQMSHP